MKYSKETLKEMAIVVLEAKKNNDFRYFDFVMTMAAKTGRTPKAIEQAILAQANV